MCSLEPFCTLSYNDKVKILHNFYSVSFLDKSLELTIHINCLDSKSSMRIVSSKKPTVFLHIHFAEKLGKSRKSVQYRHSEYKLKSMFNFGLKISDLTFFFKLLQHNFTCNQIFQILLENFGFFWTSNKNFKFWHLLDKIT